MVATPSHHTFHKLSRLLTTFLAQMRPVSDPVENPEAVSSKQPDTNDRSAANTDSTLPQVASEPNIEQAALPHQTFEPALSPVPVEYEDGHYNTTFVSEQKRQENFSDKSNVK